MKSTSHLLVLSPGFAASESDDRCIPPLQALLLALKENYQLNITVVAFHYPNQKEPYQWNGITVYPLHGKNRPLPQKLFTWKRGMQLIRRLHRTTPFNYIHSFWMGECAGIGNLLAKRFALPHWVTLMGQDALATNSYLRFLRGMEANIIALSPFHAEQYLLHTGKKVDHVIPFGIKAEDFPQQLDSERPIDVLGVGALSALKNYGAFIRTIQGLLVQHPNLNAVLIGEGEEYKLLQQQVQHAGLQQHLHFRGGCSRKEVLNCMNQSKVFLHTSTYESLGYVFEEALMSGCQVVSYAVGIASASEQWQVVKGEKRLQEAVSLALRKPPKRNEQNIYFMQQSAERYINCYHEATV
jgi:1,2-diacylglycerol 3-alpha-glucosyltransferase